MGASSAAAEPTATAKLSGPVAGVNGAAWTPVEPRPAVEHALDMIGPGRLIFGSDRPVCLLAASCTG
ncbi:amidohydrolase family protein [Micromonospora zamorensis]|uniref:amidohydrolase family protein n=1 Tax=Micromonospora zamorensis TaxID=709883 RepID=UPI0033DEEAA3